MQKLTKQVVLSLSAKQYDTLGLLSPIVLLLKVIFSVCGSQKLIGMPLCMMNLRNIGFD